MALSFLGLLAASAPCWAEPPKARPSAPSVSEFARAQLDNQKLHLRPLAGENGIHRVADGESLFSIARSYGLAVEHLAFANGYSPLAVDVPAGQELIVPLQRVLPRNPPRNGLVLNLPERGVYLFREGHFERFIAVSIGDEEGSPTPTGAYSIIERIENPTWYPPSWADVRGPVPPGPNNPLGRHWIGLSLTRTGIHGTNDPLNIGNAVTHGCIRAYPEAVADLFQKVRVGWPVRIEYETVKFGRGADGNIKMVSFPDIYGKQPPVLATQRRVGSAWNRKLSQLVELELGVTLALERKLPLLSEVRQEANR